MRVLIFHGYLLAGTGSNVYNAALAEALKRAGHEVHLLCQDRDPLALDWVDAAGDWDGGSLALTTRREPAQATVYRPDIGGLLPLYVADRYDGIEARPFQDLSEDEVDRYVAGNVAAVREVAERVRPDVALANHLVMGPVVLARALAEAGVPYAVKIHGSALEYTVKPYPAVHAVRARGARRARAGSSSARATPRRACGPRWTTRRSASAPASARPGSTSSASRRARPAPRGTGLEALRARLASTEEAADTGSSFDRSAAEAAAALATVEPDDRLVVFVGKLIASKGVELLLAAWPLVLAREPRARLLIVGFGAFRDALEGLAGALGRGDLEAARALRGEHGGELPHLAAFLDSLAADEADAYRAAARGMTDRIAWAGRLDHAELPDVLPLAEAMVVPSTFPEAFGMVAAEAAACGALPVVAAHSGLAEVAHTLARAAPGAARPWLSFEVGPGAVRELAERPVRLAGGTRGDPRRHARRDRRRHARALLVGRRRALRDRRRARRAGGPARSRRPTSSPTVRIPRR